MPENWVHLSIRLDSEDPSPIEDRAVTLAKTIGLNLIDVVEVYVLEDDGFGHLSRPRIRSYPRPER